MKATQKNQKIRMALVKNGLCLWNLEDILGVSSMTITRMMRHELPKEKQLEIISLIEKEVKNDNR